MNYYAFHIGDYAVHTRHLTLLEDLAYRRLLDLYYTRESALPIDFLATARLIGMRENSEEVGAVLTEFFQKTDAGWVQGRCDKEIVKAAEAATRARTNGSAGGRPPKTQQQPNSNPQETQRVISGNPDETKSKAPNPNPITQEPMGRQRATRIPEGFQPNPEPEAEAGIDRQKELANFRDYWSAKARDNTKLDWQATWRSWARKADRPGVSRFPDKNAPAAMSSVWHESAAGIKARAAQLGVEEGYLEPFPTFKARVMAADKQGITP